MTTSRSSRRHAVDARPSKVRVAVSRLMFWYGCLSTAAAATWLYVTIGSHTTSAFDAGVSVTVFVIHGAALALTFHSDPLRRAWPGVLPVTPTALRTGKLILVLAALNILMWAGLVIWEQRRGLAQAPDWMLEAILASMALCSAVYIAVHWAFRPENILPGNVMSFLRYPYRVFVRKRHRRLR